MVKKLAVAGNKTSVQNDSNVCDSLENVVQSVTELCIDSDKKPIAESRAKSVKELGDKIIEVSNTNVEFCGVLADKDAATSGCYQQR